MTAAMQAVPLTAIARTSTAMQIIRQAGASVGTAVLSVILATEIKANVSIAHGSGGGISTLQHLPAARKALIDGPLAHSFAETFVWATILVAAALVPALTLAILRHRQVAGAPVGAGEGAALPLAFE
jgi:hypothetical protein